MRTASANKFINFVQNLELDLEFNRIRLREEDADGIAAYLNSPSLHTSPRVITPDRSSENTDSESRESSTRGVPAGVSSSIMVSEGDLIQPEKIENGIVFNVVRRESLNQIQRSSSVDSEQQRNLSTEADVENLQMESCDNESSASECEEDHEGGLECCSELSPHYDDNRSNHAMLYESKEEQE